MKIRFVIGLRRPSTLAVPPGVMKPQGAFIPLADHTLEGELGGDKYAQLSFPLKALAGRGQPNDNIEIRVSLPDEPLPED